MTIQLTKRIFMQHFPYDINKSILDNVIRVGLNPIEVGGHLRKHVKVRESEWISAIRQKGINPPIHDLNHSGCSVGKVCRQLERLNETMDMIFALLKERSRLVR